MDFMVLAGMVCMTLPIVNLYKSYNSNLVMSVCQRLIKGKSRADKLHERRAKASINMILYFHKNVRKVHNIEYI